MSWKQRHPWPNAWVIVLGGGAINPIQDEAFLFGFQSQQSVGGSRHSKQSVEQSLFERIRRNAHICYVPHRRA